MGKIYFILLPVLVTALLYSVITRRHQERGTFNIAAVTFRSKFLSEIEGLYPIPVNWPGSIEIEPFLRSKFSKLQSAVEEFKGCLSGRRQRRFDKAWIKYYSATGEAGYQCYTHYMPFISTYNVNGKQITKDTRDTCKETFKHNVENLLSFAKQK
jgi:hypothetical protein